jgi:hypothetical protein
VLTLEEENENWCSEILLKANEDYGCKYEDDIQSGQPHEQLNGVHCFLCKASHIQYKPAVNITP